MIFNSTKIIATDKSTEYLLHGKLTIKDITKMCTFKKTINV